MKNMIPIFEDFSMHKSIEVIKSMSTIDVSDDRAASVYIDGSSKLVYRIINNEYVFTTMEKALKKLHHHSSKTYSYVCNILACYLIEDVSGTQWLVSVMRFMHELPFDAGDFTQKDDFAGMLLHKGVNTIKSMISSGKWDGEHRRLLDHSLLAIAELGFTPSDFGTHNIMYDVKTNRYRLIDYYD